jgi:hypothetical protein
MRLVGVVREEIAAGPGVGQMCFVGGWNSDEACWKRIGGTDAFPIVCLARVSVDGMGLCEKHLKEVRECS